MFVGHQKIRKYFNRVIANNKLAQCYLFAGPENVGKFTLAQQIAQRLLGLEKAGIEINNHPDFLLIKPEIKQSKNVSEKKQLPSKKNTKPIISINQIRELKRKFSLSSFSGGYKVAIIDQADYLTIDGQNTCLKLLEEIDAQKNIIILIVANISAVLPTIISRCQIINFGLVGQEEMKQIKNSRYLINLSLGRPGRLVKMIENQEYRSAFEQYFHLWREVGQKKYIWEKFKAVQEIGQNLSVIKDLIDVWLTINRQTLLKNIEKNNFNKIKNQIDNISTLLSAKKLLSKSGLNAKILLEDLILNLCFKK